MAASAATFLMTDVEDSTELWEQHPGKMRESLRRLDEIAADAVRTHHGRLIKSGAEGDSHFAVFDRAADALAAAVALQSAVAAEPWPPETPMRLRAAVHSGAVERRGGDYYGTAVNRLARLRGIARGGQVVLSGTTADLARDDLPGVLPGARLRDAGERKVRGIAEPLRVFQLLHPSLKESSLPDTFEDAAPSARDIARRRRRIWRDLAVGAVLSVVLLLAKTVLERSAYGEGLERSAYDRLLTPLAWFHRAGVSPVVVLDISKLSAVPPGGDPTADPVTPRDRLRALLEAVAAQGPRSIGVDQDFSPDEDGSLPPEDPAFFNACLDLSRRTGVPIYLGVYRAQSLPPAAWLDGDQFRPLAAGVTIPRDDARRLPRWTQAGPGAARLVSLSAAVAQPEQREATAPPGWLGWALQQYETRRPEPEASGFAVNEFLVDYSLLDSVRQSVLATVDPAVVRDQGDRLREKIVLLGNVAETRSADKVVAPGGAGEVPGVLVHACAAATLARAPLFRLSPAVSLGFDIAVTALILAVITAIRLHYSSRTRAEVASQRLLTALVWIVVVGVVCGAALLTSQRVLWLDFLPVVVVLLMHPRVEHLREQLEHGALAGLRGIWPAFLFERPHEEKS